MMNISKGHSEKKIEHRFIRSSFRNKSHQDEKKNNRSTAQYQPKKNAGKYANYLEPGKITICLQK